MVCYAMLCCAMVWYGMVGYSMVWYGSVRYDEILLGAKKKKCAFARFSPALVALFSRSRLRGTQGARLYTTVQLWVPGGLRGPYLERSKSQNLASNSGDYFRGAPAEQGHGKPTCQVWWENEFRRQ